MTQPAQSSPERPSRRAPNLLPEIPDEQLVRRILRGESALFEVLMRRYNQRLFRVSRAILRDDAEAEDVMQDAYVRAFHHLDSFEGRASFATWLTRIAIYEARARLRKGRRFTALEEIAPTSEEAMDFLQSDPRTPEDATSGRELQVVLATALDRLPEGLRAVFMLREVEGLSTAETARCLTLTEDNVKVRLHRARAALRREIDSQLGSETRRLFQFAFGRCDRVVEGVLAKLEVELPPDHPRLGPSAKT